MPREITKIRSSWFLVAKPCARFFRTNHGARRITGQENLADAPPYLNSEKHKSKSAQCVNGPLAERRSYLVFIGRDKCAKHPEQKFEFARAGPKPCFTSR
jgi:hypothetical protein